MRRALVPSEATGPLAWLPFTGVTRSQHLNTAHWDERLPEDTFRPRPNQSSWLREALEAAWVRTATPRPCRCVRRNSQARNRGGGLSAASEGGPSPSTAPQRPHCPGKGRAHQRSRWDSPARPASPAYLHLCLGFLLFIPAAPSNCTAGLGVSLNGTALA